MSKNLKQSDSITNYFTNLKNNLTLCYSIAEKARLQGKDPELFVEIPPVDSLSLRVEKLLKIEGISSLIDYFLNKYPNRELAAIMTAKKSVSFIKGTPEEILEKSIKIGLAILTEGILVAPLEGLIGLKISKNKDGSSFLNLFFSSPIRSAGGTGQALSILIADIVRKELNIGEYILSDKELKRYNEEILLYNSHKRLQYLPSFEELSLILSKCPICINGEGTEDFEISVYKNIQNVTTNKVRGGVCLVISEGLCQKPLKIKKYVNELGIKGWDFIDNLISYQNKQKINTSTKSTYKYLKGIIAGRPILSSPLKKGGFRLKYGRSRTSGFSTVSLNPATMYCLDSFLSIGTQIKIELPGKASTITSCDSIEGPLVLLKNGDLIYCHTVQDVLKIHSEISEIIDNGEILISFGDFSENNCNLPPCGYSLEWYKQELLSKSHTLPKNWSTLSYEQSKKISIKYDLPLHPNFNLFWSDISFEEFTDLRNYIITHGSFNTEQTILKITFDKYIKKLLEKIGLPHFILQKTIVVNNKYSKVFVECLNILNNNTSSLKNIKKTNVLSYISNSLSIEVRDRSKTIIGLRMGRPNKSKERTLTPPIHFIFPTGYGFKKKRELNSILELIQKDKTFSKIKDKNISLEIGQRICYNCCKTTWKKICQYCFSETNYIKKKFYSQKSSFPLSLTTEIQQALSNLNLPSIKNLKCARTLQSETLLPEPFEKGILRSKNNITVFKDGTIRYDMTNLPITHFKPKEIGLTLDDAKKLGYVFDIYGNPLEKTDQICEIKVQDIIPSASCGDFLVKVSSFIDDLLSKFYKLKTFYNVKKKEDLIGHLCVGLSPHTSGAVLSRIIGFTPVQSCFAHPFFHASKRRNCDGDEDSLILLLDCLINFSFSYLQKGRGKSMDCPLTISTFVNPKEIDKEAHNLDCLWDYPLSFYQSINSSNFKPFPHTLEKQMDLISHRLNGPLQYENIGFTHNTQNICEGPLISTYNILKTLNEKVEAQISLAKKLRSVDEKDMVYKMINDHFLPDLIGNLNKFSSQIFRCTNCETKYRRITLTGNCKCNSKLILTVFKESVKKYLKITESLITTNNLSTYLKQRIYLLKLNIFSTLNNKKIITLLDF